jgi:SEL1 protein
MYTFNAIDSFHISEPKDTYIYDLVPVAAGLATISSDDSLRLLDPLSLNGQPKTSIRKINTDVTCLKAIASSAGSRELVCTAGRDGRVCIVDPRSGSKVGEVKAGKLAYPYLF